MKRINRILLALVFIALVIISWSIVLGSTSPTESQAILMERAAELAEEGKFKEATELLEEAAEYETERTFEAETELKKVYLELIFKTEEFWYRDQAAYRRMYLDLLEKQMSRADATVDIFLEAANFYLLGEPSSISYMSALEVLKDGIEKTGSETLIELYEDNRYAFRMGYNSYEEVTASYGRTIGVSLDGESWGIANSAGELIIRCDYDKISTFDAGRAIVLKDGEIFAIDSNANRIALLKEDGATDFGNFANDRLPLLVNGKWRRATGELVLRLTELDWIGTHSGGNAAAMLDGKWGVIDSSADWVIPNEYDGIIMDELGRSYFRDTVFVRRGGSVYLLVDGQQVGEAFDDAKPFSNAGYAAVKKDGLWGFINTEGEVMIPYRFEDALSFGQHLAAVKVGDFWGYISLYGKVVIEPEFLQAKSFSNGNAPVLTERGWQFISLLEYIEREGL